MHIADTHLERGARVGDVAEVVDIKALHDVTLLLLDQDHITRRDSNLNQPGNMSFSSVVLKRTLKLSAWQG